MEVKLNIPDDWDEEFKIEITATINGKPYSATKNMHLSDRQYYNKATQGFLYEWAVLETVEKIIDTILKEKRGKY